MNTASVPSKSPSFKLATRLTVLGLTTLLVVVLNMFVPAPVRAACSGGFSATQIDSYLSCNGSPMTGMGSSFATRGQQYNVDPRFMVAIAGAETSFGKNLCTSYNAFNWFYNAWCNSPYSSWDDAINSVTHGVGTYYLQAGQTSIASFVYNCGSHCYCANCTNWYNNVRTFYAQQGGNPDTNDLTYNGNGGGGGGAVSVNWSSPSNGQTITSSTVHLQANPSGGSGGINHVSFSAKWGGNWYGVQDVYSSPWGYDWNLCNSSVPDGDIELGLIAVDNGGNQYVYSQHYSNYHITKSYNCNPIPAAPSNMRVTSATQTSITFAWDNNANNQNGFYVYKWNGSAWVNIGSTGAASYTDSSGLSCNNTYYYDVSAYNSSGESSWASPYLTAQTSSCTVAVTVTWSSPSNGQTITSSTVHLQANPSGGSGGINHVSFSAKWGGNWYGVQDVYSSPWGYDWNLCNSSVPDGDIELGLIAVDNGGNQYVYSQHYTNYHITKSYNCNSSTVQVTSVATTDDLFNSKTTFNAGDSIYYTGSIDNSTGITQTAYFLWSANGPCGSIASWSGNLDTGIGTWTWWLPSSVPSNACPGTYNYQLSVTFNGNTTSQSTAFAIAFTVGSTGIQIYLPFISDGQGSSQLSPLRQRTPMLTPTPGPIPRSKPSGK